MGWIPKWGSLWMVIPSVSALNFVSVTPYMGILFLLLSSGCRAPRVTLDIKISAGAKNTRTGYFFLDYFTISRISCAFSAVTFT